MTNIAITAEQAHDEASIISKADRYALLKMLEDKPRLVIQNALQEAARRGLFTDKMLDHAPTKNGAGRVVKFMMILGLLVMVGGLIYVVPRERITTLIETKEAKSLMGITPDDMAKAATKVGDEKYEIIYSRLSEPVRNVFKNNLPAPDIDARANVNCPPNLKQRSAAVNNNPAQRNAEPASKWIERMTAMKSAGKTNDVQIELTKFRQAYPGIVLPPALQALAC
jgi:hypothetical protein